MTMLDNPVWHSLATRHGGLAIGKGTAVRYPSGIAPFAAVPEVGEDSVRDLESLVQPGERVGILGVIPDVPWTLVRSIEIYQYVWPQGQAPNTRSGDLVLLEESQIPAMMELTAEVYPHYFRPGTARLGDYYGVIRDGRLCAMAGIRMAMGHPSTGGYQEISAICTHPDFRGQGLAGLLTLHLVDLIQAQGDTSFLHTESDNPARGMYERLGFVLHQKLPFRVLEK